MYKFRCTTVHLSGEAFSGVHVSSCEVSCLAPWRKEYIQGSLVSHRRLAGRVKDAKSDGQRRAVLTSALVASCPSMILVVARLSGKMYDSEEWCSPPQIEIIRISEVFNPIVNNAPFWQHTIYKLEPVAIMSDFNMAQPWNRR